MFEFELGSKVKINISGERGKIVGRSEFSESPSQYLLDYLAGDSRYMQGWLFASQLSSDE